MTEDRHRVYDRKNGYQLLVKEFETFVTVERPDLGAHSSRTCYRGRDGNPVVFDQYSDYVSKALELADIPYSVRSDN